MPLEIDDYSEEGVATPDSWYEAYGGKERLKEVSDIEKYILTFGYLSHFLEAMKSHESQKAHCYPDLYTFSFKSQRLGCVVVPVGAPAACTRLEDLIYMGGRSFILAGGVGVLHDYIKRGELIIPTGAIRDEGTSLPYIPPDMPVSPSPQLVEKLRAISDPETGGAYTVKDYHSLKIEDLDAGEDSSWQHTAIQLVPRNKDFAAIWINPDQVDDLRVIAEFVQVISAPTT